VSKTAENHFGRSTRCTDPTSSTSGAPQCRFHPPPHTSYLRLDKRIDPGRPLRHAVEIRHDSFKSPEFLELLRTHDVALVVADTAG
jgi:hypothetical protein